MRTQLKLPLQLKCCNPHCRETAHQGNLFCSDTCYWAIERSMHFPSIFKQESHRELLHAGNAIL